jgi:predicted nucleotidyltransferase
MSNILNLPLRPIKPVNEVTVEILGALHQKALAVGCKFFVAGATARDLILVHLFGLKAERATNDIDFGIALQNWEQFAALGNSMTEDGSFGKDLKKAQRFYWLGDGPPIPVDIIPFGGISTASQIAWPPSDDIVMNVAGFEETFRASISLQVSDELIVQVSSLPGLAVLKLMAWRDRRHATNKDAADLFQILKAYQRAGAEGRIWGSEIMLHQHYEFDPDLTAAHLLGRDAAQICFEDTYRTVQAILLSEELMEALNGQMGRASLGEGDKLLLSFKQGFLEAATVEAPHVGYGTP